MVINKLKSAEMMPGSYGLPIIGELISFLTKREEFYWQKHQANGNIFKSSSLIFGKTACLVGPEANRLVFKDAADKLSSRLGNKLLEPISADSVLLKDGEAHRTNRKLILPVFHQQALAKPLQGRIASYFDTIQSVVTEAMADWANVARSI
jgi:retinoid hydroxylase